MDTLLRCSIGATSTIDYVPESESAVTREIQTDLAYSCSTVQWSKPEIEVSFDKSLFCTLYHMESFDISSIEIGPFDRVLQQQKDVQYSYLSLYIRFILIQ